MNVFKAMTVFVRIVDEGSLSAAAASTNLSPTMVGNYLQRLEDRLGMTLLNRTTRRQHLTEFGRVYYQRCVEILELVEDTEAIAVQSQAEPRGRLRITTPSSFSGRLMFALADYGRDYPRIDIDLVITDQIMALVDDGFEAAIRIGPINDEELIARPLLPLQRVICATPDYLKRNGCPQEPADLRDHDCLLYTYSAQLNAGTVNATWDLVGPDGVTEVTSLGRIHVNNSAALRRAALAGMGIALLPEPLIHEDLAAQTLVPVLADYAPPSRPMHLIYRRDRRLSPKLRSFIDFIVDRFGHSPPPAG